VSDEFNKWFASLSDEELRERQNEAGRRMAREIHQKAEMIRDLDRGCVLRMMSDEQRERLGIRDTVDIVNDIFEGCDE
jgi:hypothetical protein